MLHRTALVTFTSLALAAASFSASADILFSNLGAAAPPATVGGHVMLPFDQAAQEAIPNFSTGISVIPGSPILGDLSASPSLLRRQVNNGWYADWAHGYTGPVFGSETGPITLTLPPDTLAFYFYVAPSEFGSWNVTATTNSGTTSGPIPVDTFVIGATGLAFYSTAGETITSITVSNSSASSGMGLAEFGIASEVTPATTCSSEGYKGAQLTWCKNICENGLAGPVLDTWIHRWIKRYRDLPYCALVTSPDDAPPET